RASYRRSGIAVPCGRVPASRRNMVDQIDSGTKAHSMRSTLFNRRRRELVTSTLLVAWVLRGLIPAGFLPASGEGFSLTICRGDLSVPSSPRDTDRHPGNPAHIEHCALGNAQGAGPAPWAAGG